MSILINGMEMPKSCLSCPLQGGTADCRLTQKTYNWGLTERPSDCPLVPVPPHGDLIDRDALEPYILNEHYGFRLVYDEVDVAHAPTIIPAEEG